MRALRWFVSALLVFVGAGMLGGTAAAEEKAEKAKVERPSYSFPLRWNEDWSDLSKGPPEPMDFWDRIKHVKLNESGSNWASFGGQFRLRLESWQNFAFAEPNDDTFLLGRVIVHGDFHFGDRWRVYLEGKSAVLTERDLPGGRRTIDEDKLALQQAFVDYKFWDREDSGLFARVGRQEFAYGKQRLVSPLQWSNAMRSWDGVKGVIDQGGWHAEAFWSQFVPVDRTEWNNSDSGHVLYGLYANRTIANSIGLDLYFIGQDRSTSVVGDGYNGTAGHEKRFTVGTRLSSGSLAGRPWDVDFETAYQFGEVGSGDIEAYMFAFLTGYRMQDWWGKPRFFVGFDYASGDKAAGGDVETFNQIFPLAHAYYGYMDYVGRQNAVDFHFGTQFTVETVKVRIAYHQFWRANSSDALYSAGGAAIRPGSPGTSRDIGDELDITLFFKTGLHMDWLIGYSHFFSGDFLTETGPDEDSDFFYLQWRYLF